MNTIDIHITKVFSVTPHKIAPAYANRLWAKGKQFVDVVLLENAYGSVRKNSHLWEKTEWEDIKKKGYYVG